jgi:hypothetical protein
MGRRASTSPLMIFLLGLRCIVLLVHTSRTGTCCVSPRHYWTRGSLTVPALVAVLAHVPGAAEVEGAHRRETNF